MPSTLNENSGTSATIHTGSENRLNRKHISPIPEALQRQNRAKRKFMRNTETISFVMTYRAWKDLFQEKKEEEVLAKLKRKKEREKKKEVKKDTAGKSSIEKTNDKRGTFFNCTKSVKLTDLVCSLCNKLFHKKCVPHQHKMLMSEEEVEDSYVCHKFSVSREFL